MNTAINYILIDFENVQPTEFSLIKVEHFKIKFFLGPNQSKIPVSTVIALQSLGERVEYISLEASGKNALDFHITYYIGVLSALEPTAFFHIISKDTGFDPLLNYLKSKKIRAQRFACISDIPVLQPAPLTLIDQVETAKQFLARQHSHPKTQEALFNCLNSLFKKQLPEQKINNLVTTLGKQGIIKVEGSKIRYSLPVEEAVELA